MNTIKNEISKLNNTNFVVKVVRALANIQEELSNIKGTNLEAELAELVAVMRNDKKEELLAGDKELSDMYHAVVAMMAEISTDEVEVESVEAVETTETNITVNVKTEVAIINREISKLSNTNNMGKVTTAIVNIVESVRYLGGYMVNLESELAELVKVMRCDAKETLLSRDSELSKTYALLVAEMACL